MEKEKEVLSKDELPPQKRNHSPETKEKKNDEKSTLEEPEGDVHSANNWESVELGGEQRKAKFLRLMGAAKKEHTGRFVIGSTVTPKPHGRTSDEEKRLEENLESQFQHSLNDRFHHRNKKHRGLGFDDEDKSDHQKDDKPHDDTADNHNRSGDQK